MTLVLKSRSFLLVAFRSPDFMIYGLQNEAEASGCSVGSLIIDHPRKPNLTMGLVVLQVGWHVLGKHQGVPQFH
jgi:hypothetical protein